MLPDLEQRSDSKINLNKVFVTKNSLYFLGAFRFLHYKIFNQITMQQNPFKISQGKHLLRQIQFKNQRRQPKDNRLPRFQQLHWQSPSANYYSRFKYLFQQQLEISSGSIKACSQDKIQLKQFKRTSVNDLSKQLKEMVHLNQKVLLKQNNFHRRSLQVNQHMSDLMSRKKYLKACREVSSCLLEKVKMDLSRQIINVQHQKNINDKLKKGQSYFSSKLQALNSKINSSKEYISRLKDYGKFIANVTVHHRLSNQTPVTSLPSISQEKIPSLKKIFPVIRSKKKLTKAFKNNSLIVSQSQKCIVLQRGQKKNNNLSVYKMLEEIQGRLKKFSLKDKLY